MSDRKTETNRRTTALQRAEITGIAINGLLAGIKTAVGLIANSVSILSEGLNNFSDCIVCLVGLVSQKLTERAPDAKHPYGYGRVEYIASFTVSIMIMFTGLNLLHESIARIITPEKPEFSRISIALLCLSAVIKFFLSNYLTHVGKKEQSGMHALTDIKHNR